MNAKHRLLPPQQKPGLGSEIDWGHPLSRGLVGCWLFNEGAGLRAQDLAKQNAGTLSGFNGTATSGWVAGGIRCDGSNDSVDLSSTPSLIPGNNDVSVTARCAFTAAAVNTAVFSAGLWGGGRLNGYGLVVHASDSSRLNYEQGGADHIVSTGAINTGAPTHIVGLRRGATLQIWADGRLAQQATPSKITTSFNSTCHIGQRGASVGFFAGTIYHVLLHSRALTDDEVRWLAAEPYAMIRPAGPMRRYFTVTALDQVFKTREQPQRFRMRELPQRFRLTEKRQ